MHSIDIRYMVQIKDDVSDLPTGKNQEQFFLHKYQKKTHPVHFFIFRSLSYIKKSNLKYLIEKNSHFTHFTKYVPNAERLFRPPNPNNTGYGRTFSPLARTNALNRSAARARRSCSGSTGVSQKVSLNAARLKPRRRNRDPWRNTRRYQRDLASESRFPLKQLPFTTSPVPGSNRPGGGNSFP